MIVAPGRFVIYSPSIDTPHRFAMLRGPAKPDLSIVFWIAMLVVIFMLGFVNVTPHTEAIAP